MATSQISRNYVYVYDLPYNPRKALCDILDADKSWETLGGLMEYDVTTLILIGQAVYRDKSPTSELLNKFSERNGKIKHLFVLLYKIDHQRAMLVLQPYVEEKYHALLRNHSTYSKISNFTCSKKEEIPRPSISQLLQSSSIPSSLSMSSTHKFSGISNPGKASGNSDMANFNQQFSSLSLHSNRKLLNVAKEESACIKILPNINGRKKQDSECKEESMSDNCISQNIKKPENALKHPKNNPKKSPYPYAVNIPPQEDCLPDIMQISYKDILKATKDFSKDLVLGKGGFGTVYKGEWKGISVAIKRLMPRHNSDDPSQHLVSVKQSLNELNILNSCRFDHILPLYAVSLDGDNPCLVYQLMVNGSLEDRLFKNKTPALTWSQRSHIAECITKGLNYLHTAPKNPLCHGDIKSANILLDQYMNAKIGDFGLTREGPGSEATHVKVSSVHGTECYLPSEYLRSRQLSPSVDIFSYGIVLLEMATGLRPLDPKRTEGKKLADFVRNYDKSGRWESLRDMKAGEENMIWFRELIQIGLVCSSEEKKKRPPMQKVLEQFKKIKEGRFEQEKIRRLSNEVHQLSPADISVTPLELQRYYDGLPNNNHGRNDVNFPHTTLPKEVVPQSSSSRKEENIDIPCPSVASTEQMPVVATPEAHNNNAEPPLPLLTVLQLQVSEGDRSCNASQEINSSENFNSNYSSS